MADVDWAFEDSKRHPLERDFIMGRQLGEGKFSIVYHARHKASGQEVAIKCIDRDSTTPDELVHEAMLIQMVEEHPGIIKILDVYEDPQKYYLVMEYVSGGELFDKIVEAEFYSEREAAGIIRQIARIVEFIHEKKVVHRDLKPENLLYTDQTASELKLCDFGLADTIEDDELLTAIVGSTTYMAPEVARGEGYDKSVDLYSIGVILYILLCGYPPFEPEAGIVDLEFPRKEWKDISKGVINLITRLLSFTPTDRPTAVELLRHPWVRGEQVSNRKLVGTIKTMKQYNIARKTGSTMRKKDEITKQTVFQLFDEAHPVPALPPPKEEKKPTSEKNGKKGKERDEKRDDKKGKGEKDDKSKYKGSKKSQKKKEEKRKSAPSDSGETHVTFISSSDAKPKNKEKELEIKCRNLEQQLSVEKKKVKQLEAEVAELKKSTSGKSHTNSSLLPGKAKKKGKSK